MSESPRIARRRWTTSSTRAIAPKLTRPLACSIAGAPAGGSAPRPPTSSFATSDSIAAVIDCASSSRPCSSSQRGLSGRWRRMSSTDSPSTAPAANTPRQPSAGGRIRVSSSTSASTAPSTVPSQ